MRKKCVILLIATLMFLYGCAPNEKITISFETNGGNLIEDMVIDSSLNFVLPEDPIKEGYAFMGWYLDNETFEVEYSSLLITNSLTLYAKWLEDEGEMMDLILFEEGFLEGEFVGLGVSDNPLKAVICDRQELITFFENYDIVWSNGTPIWDRYNNDFFETNAIILYFEVISSMTPSYILESIQMEDEQLMLHIVGQYYGDAWEDGEGFISFVMEVNKNDICGVTNYETQKTYKRLDDNQISDISENKIREDYFNKMFDKNSDSDLNFEEVYIHQFCGIYGGSVAVVMAVKGRSLPPAIDVVVIEGFEFRFHSGAPILIWNDGNFYTLQNAFNSELITIQNIETIHSIYTLSPIVK